MGTGKFTIFCPSVVAVNKSALWKLTEGEFIYYDHAGAENGKLLVPIDGAVCKYLVLDYMALQDPRA